MELLVAAKLLIAALRRRKVVALAVFLTVPGASLSAYQLAGRRYNAEALLLVGNRSHLAVAILAACACAASYRPRSAGILSAMNRCGR